MSDKINGFIDETNILIKMNEKGILLCISPAVDPRFSLRILKLTV